MSERVVLTLLLCAVVALLVGDQVYLRQMTLSKWVRITVILALVAWPIWMVATA